MLPEFRVWVDKSQYRKTKIKKWMFYVGYTSGKEVGDVTDLIIQGWSWALMCNRKEKYAIKDCPLTDIDTGFITGDKDEDSVLMQFSGERDMDGVKVWEGDVIGIFYNTINDVKLDHEQYDLAYVMFQDGCFGVTTGCLQNINKLSDLGKYKVIGNIYENPELLKTENDEL